MRAFSALVAMNNCANLNTALDRIQLLIAVDIVDGSDTSRYTVRLPMRSNP
jgi:hypothetical protein